MMKKIQAGEIDSKDIFKAIDQEGDKSGSISKYEFSSLARRLGINLTIHRINEIFAYIKKQYNDERNDEDLDEKEFDMALKYL
jgi:Ca2+-binding EF-hand superfamily protein